MFRDETNTRKKHSAVRCLELRASIIWLMMMLSSVSSFEKYLCPAQPAGHKKGFRCENCTFTTKLITQVLAPLLRALLKQCSGVVQGQKIGKKQGHKNWLCVENAHTIKTSRCLLYLLNICTNELRETMHSVLF